MVLQMGMDFDYHVDHKDKKYHPYQMALYRQPSTLLVDNVIFAFFTPSFLTWTNNITLSFILIIIYFISCQPRSYVNRDHS